MTIKQLIWSDNISDYGKNNGYFELISDVKELNIRFHIRNWKYCGDCVEIGKFYLFKDDDSHMLEFDNVNDAKLKAQDMFLNTITYLFFEQ